MAQPDERAFVTFPRGVVRDEIILGKFRTSLRQLINPTTGAAFTEDEIARATQPGSRFYIEADGIDLYGQAVQARALFLADQVQPTRAATSFLEDFHARLWLGEAARLPASGGAGAVNADATVGSIFVGSTTVPDPIAAIARDPNGRRYQVLVTQATPVSGTAPLQMKAIDAGPDTNLVVGTVLTWVQNQPLGAAPTATVSGQFRGGFPEESDQELGLRIEDVIRNRPASGNNAHFRAWGRQATNSVETVFVYATPFHAGSVLVVPTQKRGTTEGPLARVASFSVLTDVTNFVTPPNSPVVPERVFVLVAGDNGQTSDLVIRLAMATSTGGGWADPDPWPQFDAGFSPVAITTIPTPDTVFRVAAPAGSLPGGATFLSTPDAPKLMLWDDTRSRFEELIVTSVSDLGGNAFEITLTSEPEKTLAIGDYISPFTDRNLLIAQTIEAFFDGLGPGEIVDLNTDIRGARAFRFPTPGEEFGTRAGAAVVTQIIEALGGTVSDGTLESISRTDPDLPTSISSGPNRVILGKVNVHPLD